jgi:hypothetical protein
MRTPGTSLLLVFALLLLVGCGDGDSSESTSTQTSAQSSEQGAATKAQPLTGTLTKAQFLKKANAICVKGTAAMGKGDAAFWAKHRPPGGKAPSQALVNQLQLQAILPVRVRELRQIRALGLPRGDEQRVETILEAWQEGVEKGEEEPSSLDSGGPQFAFYKAYSMGIDYGLEKCWLG